MRSAAILVLVLGVLAVALLIIRPWSRRVNERDVAWIAGTAVVPGDEAEVYSRYLDRHLRHRLAGGAFGAVFAAVVGIRYYENVQIIGAGTVSPAADMFFGIVTGVVLGALSAETFRLSQPRGRAAVASLAPREPVGDPRIVSIARGVAVAALVWGALMFVIPVSGARTSAALVVAVVGLAIGGVVELTRAAVENRRRPAESERALYVDSRIRAFAGRSLSWLQLTVAVLVATWVVALTPVGEAAGILAQEAGQVVVGFLVLAGLVTTVVLLRRASPRPPRHWRPAGTVDLARAAEIS